MIIFILTYFILVIGIRSMMLYKKTNINATKNFGNQPKIKKAERIIQLALILLIVIVINYLFIATNYKHFLPIEFLEKSWVHTAGFVLGMLGLVMTFIAQLQMKDSWRLGIDKNEKTELVTRGLYSISRNPIYLNLGISFIGFFLIAPNVISFLFLLLMCYGVNEKIKDEEAFLLDNHGSHFEKYKSEVRRWM